MEKTPLTRTANISGWRSTPMTNERNEMEEAQGSGRRTGGGDGMTDLRDKLTGNHAVGIYWDGTNTQDVIDWIVEGGDTAELREEPLTWTVGPGPEDDSMPNYVPELKEFVEEGPFLVIRSTQWGPQSSGVAYMRVNTWAVHTGWWDDEVGVGTAFFTQGAFDRDFEIEKMS